MPSDTLISTMEQKYDYKSKEKQIQSWWQEQAIYTIQKDVQKPLFSIDTPPPTVSGNLHIGHIFSYTQTDIIARYQRLSGFNVFYPFGFDDNGLPTERYVEKTHEVSSYKLGRAAFTQLCLQETKKVEHTFVELWQSMGLSADFKAPYSTISTTTRALSQASFINLYKKGYIYRAYEPAPYCTLCKTSVAQAELDDQEKQTFFNTIVFQDEHGADLLIGTTRPELLPACVALFYHPDDKRYQYLHNTQAKVPLFNFTVPVYPDELVDPEKGTGLVMCCTFGDSTDIQWFKKHTLAYKALIQFNGVLADFAGILTGLTVAQARERIIQELQTHNLLIDQKEITHAVNVHERCKKEVEFICLPQWFLKLKEYKDIFISLADQVNWYPSYMKARYLDWVTNIKWDWCLSRQRFFGIPFPVWHCANCNHILLPNNDQLPVDPQEMRYPNEKCTQCGSENITPDTDVMDTWNTSSLTPYICAQMYNNDNPTEYFDISQAPSLIPMSMRPQAHDIIRTWAFDTLVKTWFHHQTVAWRDIVISGHVLSGSKEKLSKSKGQKATSPEQLLEQYPADAIRYWTATSSLGTDTAFSETQLAAGNRLITKLWNAFRFIEEHTKNIETQTTPATPIGTVNEWILHEATRCFNQYQRYFAKYELNLALEIVNTFFWSTVCDHYLELIKNQLFNPDQYDAPLVASTKRTLHMLGLRILQMYAPFIAHVTENIYQEIYKSKKTSLSLHQTLFMEVQQDYFYEASATLMHTITMLVGLMRKAKTERQLSLKTSLQTLTLVCTQTEQMNALKTLDQLLKGVCQAQELIYTIKPEAPAGMVHMEQVNELWHCTIVCP